MTYEQEYSVPPKDESLIDSDSTVAETTLTAPELERTPLRRFAGWLSSTFLFRRGQQLWEANSKRWDLPLSKSDKLLAGLYVILQDYAAGVFPPRFEDQAQAFQNEIEYNRSLPGYSLAQTQKAHATKPFWGSPSARKYMGDFVRLHTVLEDHGIKPGARLIELGCGPGWMAEWLAIAGYRLLGTTISGYDVELAEQKVQGLKCKEIDEALSFDLEFAASPMEAVDELPNCNEAFDAAYVYEALHHAFDWRQTLRATFNVLKPGGWFLLAAEPNRLHTLISYRVAKLSKTHEIGFSRKALCSELKAAGFGTVRVLAPRIDNWKSPHWIMARKDPRPSRAH